jgi:concanavalin A-like lectin/glucanase superfamily protein
MRAICILVIALVVVPFALAGETFYSALESQESVEAEGGIVDGGEFEPGKFGNGFVSRVQGDVIHFPVEGNFVNLEAGTVGLWVTMGLDASAISGETFLFMTYKRGTDAIFLQMDPGSARMRIKSANSWYNAVSPIDWKEGETHHMAGSWGPEGLHLYLDGELAASDPFDGGPTVFAETLEINNASPPSPDFPTNCVVDEVRLSDHQKQPDELVMGQAVQALGKLATTWGSIKN